MGSPSTICIVDGTYFEKSEDDYNGQYPEGALNRVVVFDQAHASWRMAATYSSGQPQVVAGAFTVTGTSFTIHATPCGQSQTLTIQYSVTPTTVSWVDPSHPNRIQNFTKQ